MWGGAVAVLASLVGTVAAPAPDTLWSASVDVPFVAQGPLLCGGAAAAMVERHWGARGVYGEDFQHLVREAEGGIRTSELTAAMRERGYHAETFTGQPDRTLAALRDGVPPILLLESGATRLHYVVLVRVDDDAVWVHDPNFGPRRRMSLDELLRRWAASGYWALRVTPSEAAAPGSPTSDASILEAPIPDAFDRDPPGPDAVGHPPVDDARPAAARSPALTEAMERLRVDDLAGARSAAAEVVEDGGPEAELGRRILATAWFLDGDPVRALADWNALGEPAIDLVRIEGMRSTRYHVALDRMSLGHAGDVLTPRSLALARRRLAQLPVIEASRIDYQPLPDGTVEVSASVLERSRVPGYPALVVQGARSLIDQRAALELGSLIGGGDRWRVSGSWEPAQRYVGGSMSAPAPPLPGVATVGVEWRRERFGVPGPDAGGTVQEIETEKRSRGSLELEEWIHPHVRVGVGLALESWEVPSWTLETAAEPVRLAGAAVTARWASDDDRSWLSTRSEGWTGSGKSFGRIGVEAGATIPRGDHREWRLRAGGTAASRDAPRTVWPGAGTGRIRDPLLRAHGLVDHGVIQGPAFGRELLHATAEHRVFDRTGPFRLGAALFVDAAHARRRAGGAAGRTFLAVGGSVFLDMGSQAGAVSLARGSSGWRLSAQVGGRP